MGRRKHLTVGLLVRGTKARGLARAAPRRHSEVALLEHESHGGHTCWVGPLPLGPTDLHPSAPHPRHVMNELLDTERAYVEELLCVLEVRRLWGSRVWAAPSHPGLPHPTLGTMLNRCLEMSVHVPQKAHGLCKRGNSAVPHRPVGGGAPSGRPA